MEKTVYIDSRGWRYKVMAGLGHDTFKARYRKPEKNGYHCCRQFEWRSSFRAAQDDLDAYAMEHGWQKLFGERDMGI